MIKTWLAHPLTQGLDINDARTIRLRRQIIQEKRFLRKIYQEWYAAIAAALPAGEGPVLELGSGPGFLGDYIPGLITSDILCCPWVRIVLDGARLPFANGALRGIVMTDVLHHLSQPRLFFAEAARCVRPGGAVTMIEPWVTGWSRMIYARMHHEPFRPQAAEWESPSSTPLSGANSALAWILFERDRVQFSRTFPQWRIQQVSPMMPFRYVLSGGVSMRSLMPWWSFTVWRILEGALSPWMHKWAMFAQITLQRREG